MEQAVLVLLLHLGVFLDLLSDPCNVGLELFTRSLTVSHKLLILSHISLQIVENLKLLIKSDQGVELVLQLDLLLLK